MICKELKQCFGTWPLLTLHVYDMHFLTIYMNLWCLVCRLGLPPKGIEMKFVQFSNTVHSDEVAHNEPPHLSLLCLLTNLSILSMIFLDEFFFFEILQT